MLKRKEQGESQKKIIALEERVIVLSKPISEREKRRTVLKKIVTGDEEKNIGPSGIEEVVIGGIIVAGGELQKVKKKRNQKKQKPKAAVKEDDLNEFGIFKRWKGTDADSQERNWTKEEWDLHAKM
ncbi:hypothetical protein B9Z19DRAFT_1069179 [Tuber borchii]|uniref:Uncharacterized protein n=1 Tax=Tuber borchii TaxID=42251 RepID=A0A2T6ZCQ5_TUBBO|nr:hypothetical protein B9Z19DRAFT_1069179 [Tuber borchii]